MHVTTCGADQIHQLTAMTILGAHLKHNLPNTTSFFLSSTTLGRQVVHLMGLGGLLLLVGRCTVTAEVVPTAIRVGMLAGAAHSSQLRPIRTTKTALLAFPFASTFLLLNP